MYHPGEEAAAGEALAGHGELPPGGRLVHQPGALADAAACVVWWASRVPSIRPALKHARPPSTVYLMYRRRTLLRVDALPELVAGPHEGEDARHEARPQLLRRHLAHRGAARSLHLLGAGLS